MISQQNGIPGFQPYHDNPPNQFGLADLKGERWWKMKRSVTPSFSTPRLKKNVPAMNEAAHKVKDTRTIYYDVNSTSVTVGGVSALH